MMSGEINFSNNYSWMLTLRGNAVGCNPGTELEVLASDFHQTSKMNEECNWLCEEW